jgi:uncharacterized protein (TIGR02594 family)
MTADLISLAPWAVVLVVFIGMAALQWRVIGALDQALARISGPLVRPPSVPAPLPLPAPAPPATPSPAPAPKTPFSDAPKWFLGSLHDIGFHETGDNQGIEEFIAQGKTGSLGDPWCAIWMNAKLEMAGIRGTRSPAALSFTRDPGFVQLDKPSLGCIVVFWRNSRASGQGHVGEYWGENDTHVWVLGGNESNMVQVEALPKDSPTFGLIGYWWPKSVALPTGGPVIMPPGSPTSVQKPPAGLPTVATVPAAPSVNFKSLVDGGYFSATPFDKSIPASIRTNNPGALNVAPWIKSAPGYVGDMVTSMSGAEANSTVIFSAPEYGVSAWLTLLQKYRVAGATTVSAIINRYGGGQDYSSYIAQVAVWSGLGGQTEILLDGDDETLLSFAKAMFRYEAGQPTPLLDAQILYGFNLARGPAPAHQSSSPPPNVT